MRLKWILPVCVAVFALALGGCAGNDVQSDANPAPASEYEGFYSAEQQFIGGDPNQALGDVNLNDIEIEQEGDVARLTLTFSLGSRYSDADEAKITSVPAYTAYCLGTPSRFVLKISGVEYWDFQPKSNWQDNPLIRGIIKQIPVDDHPFDDRTATPPMALYFQLNNAVAYRIEEDRDKIVVQLRPVKKAAQERRYYVTANAFADYQEGKFDDSLGLAPVLCDDLMDTVLISQGFERKQEAEDFMAQTAKKLEPLVPDKRIADILSLTELKGNALPVYDRPDQDALPPEPVVRIDGKPKVLPSVMQGGMYLSTRPGSGELLFVKGVVSRSQDKAAEESAVYYLWLARAEGEDPARLTQTEFSFIGDAQFSMDGTQLAILETATASGKNSLYVYDMETGVLRDLYEEGLEAEVSDFEWGQDKTLYALGSSGGAQQLIEIRLDQAGVREEFTLIDTPGGNAGGMAYWKNRIFYTYFPERSDAATGRIIEVELDNSNNKRELAAGTDFRLSPDGRFMAVIENNAGEDVYAEDPASQTTCTLNVLDMQTGKSVAETQTGFVANYIWGKDAQSLYLVTNTAGPADGQPPFAYMISTFDVESSTLKPLMDSAVSSIQAAPQEDTLFLIQAALNEYGRVSFETYALKITGS